MVDGGISLGVLRLLILSVLQVAETNAGWRKPQSLVFLEGGRWVQGLRGAPGCSAVSGWVFLCIGLALSYAGWTQSK